MRPFTAILITFVTLGSTGCVGLLTAKYNDPYERKRVNDHVTTIAMSAERRTVVVRNDNGHFCAEPPPDVSKDIASALEASAKASGTGANAASVDAGVREMVATNSVKLADRVAALDMYRTGTYVLCQYFLNGAINNDDLRKEFRILTDNVTLALVASYKNNGTSPSGTERDTEIAAAVRKMLNELTSRVATSPQQQPPVPVKSQ